MPYANIGDIAEQSEYIQEPEDNDDYNYAVEYGFDAGLHGNETVDQPEQNTYDNQGQKNLDQGHDFLLMCTI
jgi:hypothetical protein